MRKLLFFSFYIYSTLSLFAQSNASIKGHVLDADSEEHLIGVIIKVENSDIAIVSDETGHFTIDGLKEGNYTLNTQYIGYNETKQHVKISKTDKEKHVSIYIYPKTEDLTEVSVTASRRKLTRQISPVVVNQLTTATFEATNSGTVALGLNYMPGLRVENNCANCGTQEVRINGLKGEYSQILMDGQSTFSTLGLAYGLEQLPTNMIDEIEVIRGGGSVLFSSNAIGGVLNIKTKEPEKNSYETKYTLSMIDGRKADHNVALNTSFVDRSKNSGISIFANKRHRNPWDANKDGFSEIGKMKTQSIGFKAFTKPSLDDKFTVEYHHITDFRRGGDHINKPPHETMMTESTDYTINSGAVGYIHASNNDKNILSINTGVQSIRRTGYFGEGMDLNGYGNTSEIATSGTVRYAINSDKVLFMPATFTVGYTFDYTNLSDSTHSRQIKQVIGTHSLYAQNEWKNDKLSFTLGVRAEKHRLLPNYNFIPRISSRFKLNDAMNLRASYSMGYRAPQVTAADLDQPVIGGSVTITQLDENLKREYSHAFNGGIDFTFYNENIYSYFLVEGFYTKINRVFIEEEIGNNEIGNMVIMRKNGDGAYVYGINLETNIQPLMWLDVQGGITLQQSRYTKAIKWSSEDYVAPVKKMLRSPNTYGFLTATASPKKNYSFSLSGVYTGSMYTPHFAGGIGVEKDKTEKTKNFIDATAKLSYFVNLNATNQLEISGGVQNIFNQIQKDYDKGPGRDSEYIYGPTLPRTYFVGIKLSSL